MAVHTYRLAAGSDGNFAALAESDQTAATRTDGWTVGMTAAGNTADFDNGTKQPTTAFSLDSTTAKPEGFLIGATANAFKSPTAITGVFAATAWSLTFAVRSTGGTAQRGRMRLRVFKSVNADGSAATELTTATQVGSTLTAMMTGSDNTTVVTWSPGKFTLNSEYLFFVLAWEITTAGGGGTNDVVLRTGSASSAGSRIVTPDLARPLVAAQISGTSSVGGNPLHVLRRLQFAGIVSGASVTSVVVTKRAIITSSVISGASVIGSVGLRLPIITPGIISAGSVVGMVTVIRPIDPQINGQSNVFGTVTKQGWRLLHTATSVNSSGSTLTVPATTVGSVLLASQSHDDSNTFVPAGGGTWQLIGNQLLSPDNQRAKWYACVCASSVTQITGWAILAASWCYAEFAPPPGTASIDVSDATKAYAANGLTSNNITPAGPGELLAAAAYDQTGTAPTFTAPSGWTMAVQDDGTSGATGANALAYKIGSSGAQGATFTYNKSGDMCTVQILAAKPGSSSGLKILLAATINGVSNITGRIQKGTANPVINGSSVVSGGIGGKRPIVSATISGSSTVGGTIHSGPQPSTPVLDTFNRADGDPGANWNGPAQGHPNKLAVKSNRITSAAVSALGQECWVANTFGPATTGHPVEVFCQMTTVGPSTAHNNTLLFLDSPTSATANGYAVVACGVNWSFFRIDNGSSTNLGSSNPSSVSGDWCWLKYDSTGKLSAYASHDGVSWTLIGSITDTTYLAKAWYIATQYDDQTVNGDNFGGGLVSAISTKPITAATINGSSTVSGGIEKKGLVSGAINGTSTVSGKVTRIAKVAATVSATSAVSGTVTKPGAAVPSTVFLGQPNGGVTGDTAASGALVVNGPFSTDGTHVYPVELMFFIDSLTGSGPRSQAFRFALFPDDGSGHPSTTATYVTDEVIVSDTSPIGAWLQVPIIPVGALSPSTTYWLGLWRGTSVNGGQVGTRRTTGATGTQQWYNLTVPYSSTANPVVSSYTAGAIASQYQMLLIVADTVSPFLGQPNVFAAENDAPSDVLVLTGPFVASANTKIVDGRMGQLHSGTGGTQKMRMAVVGDSGSGTPAANPLAVSDEVLTSDTPSGGQFVTFPFTSPPTLTKGQQYWLGPWWGGKSGGYQFWIGSNNAQAFFNQFYNAALTYVSTGVPTGVTWTNGGSGQQYSAFLDMASGGVTKPITAATINGASVVSGSLSKRGSLSGAISATSTVSGKVAKLAKVAANISATSTVSGGLGVSTHPTTPILDNFNRADGDPGPNWDGPSEGHPFKLAIQSNRITSAANGLGQESWIANTFGPVVPGKPVEVYWQMTTIGPGPGNSHTLLFLDSPTSPTSNGYAIVYSATDATFYNIPNGSSHSIGSSVNPGLVSGDWMWLKYDSNGLLSAYTSHDGVNWTLLNSVTDTTFLGKKWYIAGQLDNQTVNADSFGGGQVNVSAKPIVTATISGTSTVSGSAHKLAKITAQINASSAVTGTISTKPVKIIGGGNINGTSSVSGHVTRAATAQITGSSIVSANLTHVSGIRASINAFSIVSGKVVVLRFTVASTVNAHSTVTCIFKVKRAGLAGNILATSTVSGIVTVSGQRFITSPKHRLLSAGQASTPILSTVYPSGHIISTVER